MHVALALHADAVGDSELLELLFRGSLLQSNVFTGRSDNGPQAAGLAHTCSYLPRNIKPDTAVSLSKDEGRQVMIRLLLPPLLRHQPRLSSMIPSVTGVRRGGFLVKMRGPVSGVIGASSRMANVLSLLLLL
jgi:hypothetical protein